MIPAMPFNFLVTIPVRREAHMTPGSRYVLSKHRTRRAAELAARKVARDSDLTGLMGVRVEEIEEAPDRVKADN